MEATDTKLDEQIEQLQNKLQEYTKTKGISKNTKTSINDINKYLEMDQKELRSLSEEDCSVGAYTLGQAALEIQREINEYNAIIRWLDAQITKTIASQITNYKTYSYEGNKNAAIQDNSYSKKAFEIKVRFEMRVNSLQYISQEIKNLSSILIDIKNTKRRYTNA